ncbi:DNA-3-methyladenine glycosylase I [Oceaniserpentilla sp. 4NH20-0058]|uniref:DNA-3-methyladenine glycosylase I n=1 Tax=Oceaniserpentilla sp. 4NH20-0058 TaxID=3127660 RepID=UPI00310A09E1
MKDFDWIYHRAEELKGADFERLLPEVISAQELVERSSDYYLSLIGLRIFRAGLKHSVVDSKWPNFEKVFNGFKPAYVASLSDEALEQHMLEPGLIKHWGKIKALRINAAWLLDLEREQGGFGQYIANWPVTDIVSLWLEMKKHGAQLGGRSAQAIIRMAGKDTFQLSEDVMVQLRALGVVSKVTDNKAKRDLVAIQHAFNEWHQQSGYPMSHISRMLSFT